MASDDDDLKKKPFLKIKTLLNRLVSVRSRSTSPNTLNSNNIIFSAGTIAHKHTIPLDSVPSKFILLSVSHEGQLLDIPTQPSIGFIVCTCRKPGSSDQNKNIAFILSPHAPRLSRKEHFVDSSFLFPSLTKAQKSTSKSYPLFFKLPPHYANNVALLQEQSEELKSIVLARLQELTEHVEQDDVDHVYARLFDTEQELDLDLGTQSSEDSSSSIDSQHQQQSGTSSSLSTRLRRASRSPSSLGILIYSHREQSLKTLDLTEQQKVFKALPQSTQERVRYKLASAGSFAGIFLDNSKNENTTTVHTLTTKEMRILRNKLYYKTVPKKTLNFTLAPLSEVQKHAPKLVQRIKIPNSKQFMDSGRKFIMDSVPNYQDPNHKDSKAKSAHSQSQSHSKSKHNASSHRKKHRSGHSPPTPNLTDSSPSSASSSDSDSATKFRDPSTNSIMQKQIYQPPILDDASCPATYHAFWKLKAKTRRLPPNNEKLTKFVAPHFPLTMLQLAEQCNFPDLLAKEFTVFAQAYDGIVKQKNYSSVTTTTLYTVGVLNSEQDLSLTGNTRILDNLKKNAPQLEPKTLSKLTEAKVTQFFFLARTYMLTSSIPWDSFSDFFLTPAVLGPEIHAKVTNALIGYPTHKQLLKNFSSFIEHIILKLLPVQESYYDAEVRILEKHKQHLTGPNPSIDYTKTYIHSDAQDLTTKSPYYKQVHDDITDEQHRMMVENEKTNLLHKIITHTTYDAKIHKLLIGSAKYKDITDVPNNELLDNLQSLIVAEEKSAIALVNATRLPISVSPKSNRNTSQTSTSPRYRTQTTARRRSQSGESIRRGRKHNTANRSSSRSPQNRDRPSRRPSYSPNRKEGTSKPQLQERCDNCLRLNLNEEFCHSNNHCRRDGHQPDFRNSSELERKYHRNDPDTFITHNNCNKCFPLMQKPTQWLHGNTSSQVLIPPNYFNGPFRPPPNYVNFSGVPPAPVTWQPPPPWQQPQYQEYTPQNMYNQSPTQTTHNYSRQSQGEHRHRSPYRGQNQSYQAPQERQDWRQNSKR